MNETNASLFYQEPANDEIALNAFLIWEKEGRQPGRELHYWLQAEGQLREARRKKAEAAAALAAQPWPRTAGPGVRRVAAKPVIAVAKTTSPKTKRSVRVAA